MFKWGLYNDYLKTLTACVAVALLSRMCLHFFKTVLGFMSYFAGDWYHFGSSFVSLHWYRRETVRMTAPNYLFYLFMSRTALSK